ncbi:pentapeptide repeat-containing protein [Streptomyces anthocyanicus]
MSPRLPRRKTERRGLRLWPVGPVLVMTFTAALLVATAVFYSGWHLLNAQGLKPEHRIDSRTLFDLVKLSFGVVAGAGALVALVVAYRRQRVDEDGALREATRLHTERFTIAVSQLGDESAAVRLGGVHALSGLADDAPTQALRQTCIDVLCAYLQLPHPPDPGDTPGHQDEHHRYLALRKVRHTILRLIADHYRRPSGTHGSWQGSDLDLSGITIDGPMNFRNAHFSGGTVNFSHATFSDGTVHFDGATFSGSTMDFSHATFSDGTVHFDGATFSGSPVHFDGATFSGASVFFGDARVSDGTMDFSHATFSGGMVYFARATFSGGTMDFRFATFSGASVYFSEDSPLEGATFSGTTVHFARATFSGGTMDFSHATFSGSRMDFSRATFSGGTMNFSNATFPDGTVDFRFATVPGSRMDFSRATFSGDTVNFSNATFSGGTVDFERAQGVAPLGLVPPTGTPLPPGLTVPTRWLS